ncbi:MAG: hypothetical protein JWM11_3336 [Planctomycetaceae bacterium]|nr:hypothetical protein [Planctomycetaceae bacterium]
MIRQIDVAASDTEGQNSMKTTDSPDDQLSEAIVTTLLAGLAISTNSEDSKPAQQLLSAVTEIGGADRIVGKLFPLGIPINDKFFERIESLRDALGNGDSADEPIGYLWGAAFGRVSNEQQQGLFDLFLENKRHDLFVNLGSFPSMIAIADVSPKVLADWLSALHIRIERDFAQDGFWKALRILCAKRIDRAFDVLGLLTPNLIPSHQLIATVLLGHLRCARLSDNQSIEFRKVELAFRDHTLPVLRSCYNWSWSSTVGECGLTAEQFLSLLERAQLDERGDAENLLGLMCRLVQNPSLPAEMRESAATWVSQRLSPGISGDSKYHVVDVAWRLHDSPNPLSSQQFDATEWILAIQPIGPDETGTWNILEQFLVKLLKADVHRFSKVFRRLASSNAAGLGHVVGHARGPKWLLREMQVLGLIELIGSLMLSSDRPTRKLGFQLFEELEAGVIPASLFSNNPIGLQLLFYEMQLQILRPQSLARIFVSLLPHIQTMSLEFRAKVKDELSLQATNFRGEFRAELQRLGGHLDVVRVAMDELTSYLDRLEVANRSGIASIEVAGARRAAVMYRRRISQHISSAAEEHSVLMAMTTKVQLLYSRVSSTFINGKLQDSQPLSRFSSGVEMPFMDFCDPEEMAMRRMSAAAAISALVRGNISHLMRG